MVSSFGKFTPMLFNGVRKKKKIVIEVPYIYIYIYIYMEVVPDKRIGKTKRIKES